MHVKAQIYPTPFAVLAVLAAVALLLPFPGSLSVVVSRWAMTETAALPAVDLLSTGAVGALALATAAAALHAWRAHRDRLPLVIGASLGVGVAYALSEGMKVVLAQGRPCARWDGAAHCPPAGDWSLPSNHATVAFAALVVIGLATRSASATWVAGGLGVLAATGRVLEGVHYLHDVALGALLGMVVAAGAAAAAGRVHRLLSRGEPGR
jgi:undecaprenyl-diphosphatase